MSFEKLPEEMKLEVLEKIIQKYQEKGLLNFCKTSSKIKNFCKKNKAYLTKQLLKSYGFQLYYGYSDSEIVLIFKELKKSSLKNISDYIHMDYNFFMDIFDDIMSKEMTNLIKGGEYHEDYDSIEYPGVTDITQFLFFDLSPRTIDFVFDNVQSINLKNLDSYFTNDLLKLIPKKAHRIIIKK